MAQSIDKQIGALAAIEPERHFVQVRLQVFRADLVPRSDDAALQERESFCPPEWEWTGSCDK